MATTEQANCNKHVFKVHLTKAESDRYNFGFREKSTLCVIKRTCALHLKRL